MPTQPEEPRVDRANGLSCQKDSDASGRVAGEGAQLRLDDGGSLNIPPKEPDAGVVIALLYFLL